jgi:uncharacterized repeat protein (TIGR01451 family)
VREQLAASLADLLTGNSATARRAAFNGEATLAATPSPFNGERAGVRGGNTRQPPAPEPPSSSLLAWEFNRNGDLQGWQPNTYFEGVVVTNGALSCRAVGHDPILELQPQTNLPTSPWQALEVCLRADHDGIAEFFWSNTTQTRYGGFSQDKTTRFAIEGDGRWRTYQVLPFWHPEGKIIRLRFDLFGGAAFDIDFIRVVDYRPSSDGVVRADFGFQQNAAGWRGMGGAEVTHAQGALEICTARSTGFVLAPPIRVDAARQNFLCLKMAVSSGRMARLFYALEDQAGLQSQTFPVKADGQDHLYNIDLLAAPAWQGRVLALGLQPSDVPGATSRMHWLKLETEPQGPAELELISFGLDDALPRVGQTSVLTARVTNRGGAVASNLQMNLTLPTGLQLASAPASRPAGETLAHGEEALHSWDVTCVEPTDGLAELVVSTPDTAPLQARARLQVSPRAPVSAADYVPEPKPVRGDFEVGVYYFPGWKEWGQWEPISRFPERKPVLGWYREGDPEVADWHIKWAVEHGITFFVYDWYWSQGARQLEHALHDGYFKARYRRLLKFCLLWANHNPPQSSSLADCRAVTRHWIEHYFRQPEHLTLANQPVVVIFSPHRLTEDLGAENVRPALDAMREECRRAGLPGLYLIACIADAGQARQAAAEGYDAVTAYTWPHLGRAGDALYAPFEGLLEGYRCNWQHITEQSPIPLLLPVSGGWDSRPWHGDNQLVRFGRTPELFRRHLQDAFQFLQTRKTSSPVRKFLLIEAWNEWGEGSYIEPHQEFGFGYLDAIRETTTPAARDHLDLTPADVSRGPYDLPRAVPRQTAWQFSDGLEGWGQPMQLTNVEARGGVLTGRTTGHDPAWFGPPLQARAADYPAVELRMRLSRTDGGETLRDRAQLFWRTSRLAESEATSTRFEVQADGQWHEYRLELGRNPRWRGMITRLRLDPCNRAGILVEVDSIRLAP